jgi:hypothetical protein
MTIVRWPPADDPGDPGILVARPFGVCLDDLAVSFTAPLNVGISALLRCCLSTQAGEPFSAAEIAGWTVARRRQGLLAVAVATHGPLRRVTITCPDPADGARLDLELDLRAFRRDWRADRVGVRLSDGSRVTLRHPTPADLSRWAEAGGADAEAFAASLLIPPRPEAPDWAEAAQAALSEADPLADMTLEATCPDCGAAIAHPFAVEPFLMGELMAEAGLLVDEIHVLAMAYHWSELEILALPDDRRRHYLARVREAWAA